jgi:hypothetical protein
VTTRHRKISTTPRAIKPALALSVAGCLLAACVGPIAEAPFPARPDTVVAGDLRGPFDGRVVDADSGKPVEDATVIASWAFETGRGLVGPAGASTASAATDADGRYRIDRVRTPRDGRWRIARFTLVVWKSGYLGYRSDRRFSDLGPRHDFAQTNNSVRLEPLRAEVSLQRVVAFLGVAGPLLPVLEEELARAPAAPTETAASTTARPAGIDPEKLLTVEELKAVTRYDGAFTEEPLPDRPASATYGSLHFKAVGKPEKFDAAIRVYRFPEPGEDLEKRFSSLVSDLPAARETDEVGDRSLRTREQNPDGDVIQGVAALDRGQRAIVVLTCGEGLCADADTVVALMRRMVPRLPRLSRTDENTP